MTEISASHIKDYLLGNLTGEQETRLEERYFSDPQCVTEIWAVFADLSELYLSGKLSEGERAQFENRLNRSPTLRQMFENERALFSYAASVAPENNPAETGAAIESQPVSPWSLILTWLSSRPFQVATLSAGLLVAAVFWFVWQWKKTPPPDSNQVALHREETSPIPSTPQPANSPSPTPPTAATPQRNQSTVATFFIPAQLLRSGADFPLLNIPREARTVRLELELMNSGAARYSATLQSETNKTLQSWESLSPQRGSTLNKIVLRLPAHLLSESGYSVKIKPLGGDEAFTQEFRFTVKRR